MLAHEPFSDRTPSISPTIGAFLRTYNDGLDQERRQDLYSVAAAIVGTASGRAVERERIDRCLAFALHHGGRTPASRASLALATPEPAGAWAALTALKSGAHDEALSLVDELVALSSRRALAARLRHGARAGEVGWRQGTARSPGATGYRRTADEPRDGLRGDATPAPAGVIRHCSFARQAGV